MNEETILSSESLTPTNEFRLSLSQSTNADVNAER
jgi:hypothetical protein